MRCDTDILKVRQYSFGQLNWLNYISVMNGTIMSKLREWNKVGCRLIVTTFVAWQGHTMWTVQGIEGSSVVETVNKIMVL